MWAQYPSSRTHRASLSAGNNNGALALQSYGSEITLSADSFSPHGPLLFTTLFHLLTMKGQSLQCNRRHQTPQNHSLNTPAG